MECKLISHMFTRRITMHKFHATLAVLLVALLMLPVAMVQADTLVALVTTAAGSADGAIALVADTQNHTIRKLATATGVVTTLAGSPRANGSANGVSSAARFF